MTKCARKDPSRQLRSSHCKPPSSHCSFKRVAKRELTLSATERYAWTDATCPVCLECPHNAVLLLCSSHDNGCRPYICATNFRQSNCLNQLVKSCGHKSSEELGSMELKCPLCRGEVKGYTLVEPARQQLNKKRRKCMQDGCSYIGTYRELCRHVKKKHPSANPRAVDPVHALRWRRLIFRSSLQDMICSTTSPFLQWLFSTMLQYGDFIVSAPREYDDDDDATDDDSDSADS
ncbi:hypothetical protein ACP4OV_023926 [Aristida adscensionis]